MADKTNHLRVFFINNYLQYIKGFQKSFNQKVSKTDINISLTWCILRTSLFLYQLILPRWSLKLAFSVQLVYKSPWVSQNAGLSFVDGNTLLHRDVNPKVTFANKTQHILLFVTKIQSSIGLLKSFIVGKYLYHLVKTLKTPLCNVK